MFLIRNGFVSLLRFIAWYYNVGAIFVSSD